MAKRLVLTSPALERATASGNIRPTGPQNRRHGDSSLFRRRGGLSAPGEKFTVTGPFAVTLEGGTTIKVWDSSGGEGAGIVTIGSYSEHVAAQTFPVQTGEVYLDVTYSGGTFTGNTYVFGTYSISISIAARTPSRPGFNQYVLRLGGCTVTGGTIASVYQTRAPGDVEVIGRWMQ